MQLAGAWTSWNRSSPDDLIESFVHGNGLIRPWSKKLVGVIYSSLLSDEHGESDSPRSQLSFHFFDYSEYAPFPQETNSGMKKQHRSSGGVFRLAASENPQRRRVRL